VREKKELARNAAHSVNWRSEWVNLARAMEELGGGKRG